MPNRTTIRTAIKTVLINAGTFGTRVYIGRYDAIPESALPAARVSLEREDIEAMTHLPRRLARIATYIVEVYAVETSGTEVEAALDTLTQAVEEALDGDTTLSGACKDIMPVAIVYDVSTDNGKDYGRAEISYRVYYQTVES